MLRAIAVIDGEHYPSVVRSALDALSETYEIVGAVFAGGTEKIEPSATYNAYGVPVIPDTLGAPGALREAIARFSPDIVIDLSDEPVVSVRERFALASVALGLGVDYTGADFEFRAPRARYIPRTPTLSIIGTGKRVGKTSVSAYAARTIKAAGHDVVVLAMGRGGPSEPELIYGDRVVLTTENLLALAAAGKHAASDNYEDAIMSRVTTVGCRRCGGGLAGDVVYSNVPQGARMADSLGKELMILEGSGAAIPPVHADSTLLVVGAGRGVPYVSDCFGPYRVGRADAVVITGAEAPLASAQECAELVHAIRAERPDIPIALVTFRPRPLEDIAGARVFFATTAPEQLVPVQVQHLEREYGCTVVSASPNLSNRARLRADMDRSAGCYELLVTELKAAAIDVAAAEGARQGVRTVLCDNEPHLVDGPDLTSMIHELVKQSLDRCQIRSL